MSAEIEVPEKFEKIITDFIGDIIVTFPEYELIINKWWKADNNVHYIFKYCLTVFPERFLDILYKKVEIFDKDSSLNTDFLPGISFKYLWQCDISDATRETIWKYLQLISISIVGCINSSEAFGDTAKIFESINENEFKDKLAETLGKMQSLFENESAPSASASTDESGSGSDQGIPSADDIHARLSGMMGGKLGDLAREIAEETVGNLNIDTENITDVKDIFQNLFKNPGKLMGLVKNVGDKLDSRIKSGEIKESELLAEATSLMGKMKDMPGMDNIQEMMAKMGMGGLPKGAKVDTSAMERNMKNAQMKEKMRKALDIKRAAAAASEAIAAARQSAANSNSVLTDEQLISVFSTGEKVEKTPVNAKPPVANGKPSSSGSGDKKKKKSKK